MSTSGQKRKTRRVTPATQMGAESGCGEHLAAESAPPLPEVLPHAQASRPLAKDVAHITAALQPLAVKIDSIRQDPRNARKHNERNRTAISYSLAQFGQQKPISVDADGIILAGNGTYAEAVALGWKYIAVVKSELRGADARAFAVADNRTAELAEWDVDELVATLDELNDGGMLTAGLEFSDEEIDKLIDEAEADNAPEPAKRPKGNGSGSGSGEALAEQWKIVLECTDETDQVAMLERFKAEGRKCRALIG